MKSGFDDLVEIYNEYQKINRTYQGDKTDWTSAAKRLQKLYSNVSALKIRQSKNSLFYDYIRKRLKDDVFQECKRVEKLAYEQTGIMP